MLQNIENIISNNVDSFIQEIHDKFGVSVEEMQTIWKTVSSEKKKNSSSSATSSSKKNSKKSNEKKSNKKKLSSWLQFSHDQRTILKKDHPNLTFGEISKKISEAWKLLSTEEKKNYFSKSLAEMGENDDTDIENDENDNNPYITPTTPSKEPDNIEKDIPVVEEEETIANDEEDDEKEQEFSMTIYTSDQLSIMKTKELKEICDNLHLSKTGKKQELIDRITNCQQSLVAKKKKTTTTNHSDNETENDDDYDNDDPEYHVSDVDDEDF